MFLIVSLALKESLRSYRSNAVTNNILFNNFTDYLFYIILMFILINNAHNTYFSVVCSLSFLQQTPLLYSSKNIKIEAYSVCFLYQNLLIFS